MRRFDSWLVGLYLARQQFLESVLFLTGHTGSVEHQLFTAAERQVNIWASQEWERVKWPADVRDWARLHPHDKSVEVGRVARVIAHRFNRLSKPSVEKEALTVLRATLRADTLRGVALASQHTGLTALLALQKALESLGGDWRAAAVQHKDVLCKALAEAGNRATMEDAIVELALFHAPEAAKVDTFISAHNQLFGLRGLLLGETAKKPLKGQAYHWSASVPVAGMRPMPRPGLAAGTVFTDHLTEATTRH